MTPGARQRAWKSASRSAVVGAGPGAVPAQLTRMSELASASRISHRDLMLRPPAPVSRAWLLQPVQRDVELANVARGALPLDQDRALVDAFDGAGAPAVARDQEADRAPDAVEMRRRDSERAGEQTLEQGAVQAERLETRVEHADQVVLRVAERLARHRARIGQRLPVLLGHEPERVPQYRGHVVLHEQRLELVDRERGVALTAPERDVQSSLADVGARHELGELLVEPERPGLEIDRVDRVSRDRYLEPDLAGDRLAVVAVHAGLSATRPPVVDPVEVDEAHGFAGAVGMRDAGLQAAGDEGQVRVAVARLDRALRGVEVLAALEAIVRVAGALREDAAERLDVRRDATEAEARDQAPVEKAGRRVGRPVKAARIRGERFGVLAREARPQLDHLEPLARR